MRVGDFLFACIVSNTEDFTGFLHRHAGLGIVLTLMLVLLVVILAGVPVTGVYLFRKFPLYESFNYPQCVRVVIGAKLIVCCDVFKGHRRQVLASELTGGNLSLNAPTQRIQSGIKGNSFYP